MAQRLKFVDLFAGIGGFHLALHGLGAQCVFASEIDRFARMTYEHNFKKSSPSIFPDFFNGDIKDFDLIQIPFFDILCAGFPCQPFSQAGLKKGFDDKNRGNLFFTIRDIIKIHRPKAIFLENVRNLESHDLGRTFEVIKDILENELEYDLYHKVIKASDCGLPQYRPRLYMVGFRKEDKYSEDFNFPESIPLTMSMSDIWGGVCNRVVGYTLRVGGRSSGIKDRHNWDSYLVDGLEKVLGVQEGKKMMGFPVNFEFPVSNTQAMKQLGNSVAINVIAAIASNIIKRLNPT